MQNDKIRVCFDVEDAQALGHMITLITWHMDEIEQRASDMGKEAEARSTLATLRNLEESLWAVRD